MLSCPLFLNYIYHAGPVLLEIIASSLPTFECALQYEYASENATTCTCFDDGGKRRHNHNRNSGLKGLMDYSCVTKERVSERASSCSFVVVVLVVSAVISTAEHAIIEIERQSIPKSQVVVNDSSSLAPRTRASLL